MALGPLLAELPADLPMVDERWTRSLARGETYEAEFRLRPIGR